MWRKDVLMAKNTAIPIPDTMVGMHTQAELHASLNTFKRVFLFAQNFIIFYF